MSLPLFTRHLLCGTALGAVLVSTAGLTPARAQYAAAPLELPSISVKGGADAGGDYQSQAPTLTKLTQPLLDTPQTVDAIPRQVMDDQGATTLRDALRNVPGLSLAAGENSAQGDNFTIRGFTARNDIYLDGMNDFGSYYRDPFFLEDVQVLKGPASILFGRGSTGGVVEQDSKQPRLKPFTDGTISFGTDATKRVTADVDRPVPELGQGAAFRLNVMGNDNNIAGRDQAEYSRFGIAPSLSLGLGTDTRVNFSYLHQTEYDTPDYGLPWLYEGTAPGAGGSATALARPAPVPESSFYGFSTDYLRTNVDIPTVKVEHDFSDSFTLRDQLRYGHYQREFRITEPQLYIPGTNTSFLVAPGTPLGALSVTRNQLYGSSLETFLQNQTDATLKFATGPLSHTLVAGLEFGRETSDPVRYSTLFGAPGSATPSSLTSLVAPDSGTPYNASTALSARSTGTAFTQAAYALDTLKINDQWQIMGGVRLDRFDANIGSTSYSTATGAQSGAVALNHVDLAATWRGAVIYKPVPNGTIYVSAGTSFDPSIEALSLTASSATSTGSLAPERTKSYELGSKWDFLHERLSLTGALFQSEQTNLREVDPNNPLFDILAGDALAKGFELGVTGRITDNWQVLAGYAYTFSEIEKSPVAGLASDLGHRLGNVPMHTANFWTTYTLPWKLQIGAGIDYESSRYAATTPTQACTATPCTATNGTYFWKEAPGYWTLSAMAKYPLNDNVNLQLNLYNLTDNYYFDQLHPSHVVPGGGRSALFTVSFKY